MLHVFSMHRIKLMAGTPITTVIQRQREQALVWCDGQSTKGAQRSHPQHHHRNTPKISGRVFMLLTRISACSVPTETSLQFCSALVCGDVQFGSVNSEHKRKMECLLLRIMLILASLLPVSSTNPEGLRSTHFFSCSSPSQFTSTITAQFTRLVI